MHFSSRHFAHALLQASLLTSLSTSAFAAEQVKAYPVCTEGPSESDISAARGAYEAGQVSFHEADYDRALLYWEDAFRRDCTADKLLLNIARAYELSSDLKSAVNALQTYVERRPDAPDVSSVEKRIQKLQEHIDEQAAAAPPVVATEPVSEPVAQEAASDPTSSDDAGSEKPLWPVFVTAGGGVALIAGAIMAPIGHSQVNSDEVNQQKDAIAMEFGCTRDGLNWECPNKAASDGAEAAVDDISEISSGKTLRTVGFVTGGVGLAAALVGGIFWYRTWSSSDSDSAWQSRTILTPVATPDFQGLNISGTF